MAYCLKSTVQILNSLVQSILSRVYCRPESQIYCVDSFIQSLVCRACRLKYIVQNLERQGYRPLLGVQSLASRFYRPESRKCCVELIVQSLASTVQILWSRDYCLEFRAQSLLSRIPTLVWNLLLRFSSLESTVYCTESLVWNLERQVQSLRFGVQSLES